MGFQNKQSNTKFRNSERVEEILRRGEIRAEQIGLNSRFREEYIDNRVKEIIAISNIRFKLLNYD